MAELLYRESCNRRLPHRSTFASIKRRIRQADLLSAAIGDRGEGGLSANRGLKKQSLKWLLSHPQPAHVELGTPGMAQTTPFWQAVHKQQLHPYRQKFSVGPAEYTRVRRLVGGSSIRNTQLCGTTRPATIFPPISLSSIYDFLNTRTSQTYVISGFRREEDENCTWLGYTETSVRN